MIVPFENCGKSLSTSLTTIQENMTGSNFLPLLEVRQQWKCLFKLSHLYLTQCYGNMGYGVSSGGTNKKDFCLRIKILKGNYWILRIVLMGRCQKCQNSTFKINFLYHKVSESFSFFSMKNMDLGAHFLLLPFFDNINFRITLFSKMTPDFWHLPINLILRIQ